MTEVTKTKRTRPDLVTGRTKPWGTKLSPEWTERIRDICYRDRINNNDLIERAVEAYEREQGDDPVAIFMAAWERASGDQRKAIHASLGEWVKAQKRKKAQAED